MDRTEDEEKMQQNEETHDSREGGVDMDLKTPTAVKKIKTVK